MASATLTYAAFAARIEAAARALKSELGVGRGDRVAILAANHPDYLVLLYACARLGAMLVPLNWRLAVPEQLFILTDARSRCCWCRTRSPRGRAAARSALPTCASFGCDGGGATTPSSTC